MSQGHKWSRFERKIQTLLRNCKFECVGGGPDFKIAGRQVDAFAEFRDVDGKPYLLIIEATSKKNPGTKDIRGKIKEFNDIKTDIEEVLNREGNLEVKVARRMKGGTYGEQRQIQISKTAERNYILALEDIEYDGAAIANARKYGILIWGSKYCALSFKLGSMIGEYAKYTILRELGGINLEFDDGGREDYLYTAFKIDMTGEARGYTYVFPILPEKLLKLAYVYRRELSKEQIFGRKNKVFNTYQRMLIAKKIREIGEDFLGASNGTFKNNIILVFEAEPESDHLKVHVNSEIPVGLVDLSIPKRYASIRLLDGQHRLYGFLKAPDLGQSKKKSLIVAGFVPEGTEEASTFLSINRKQTPVNTDILWDLYSVTQPRSKEAICSDTIKALNESEFDNPFFHQINLPGNTRGGTSKNYELGLGNLAKTLADLNLTANPGASRENRPTLWVSNHELTVENGSKVIIRLYKYLESRLGDEQANWFRRFFLTNNGFNVAMRLLSEALRYYGSNTVDYAQLDETRLNKGVLFFIEHEGRNLGTIRTQTSSEGTRGNVAARMIFDTWLFNPRFGKDHLALRSRLREKRGDTSDLFFSDIHGLISEIITDLRIMTDNAFKDEKDWWERFVPSDVREYASKHTRSLDKVTLNEKRLYFIAEGHLLKVIADNYNRFFRRRLRSSFYDRDDFMDQISMWKDKRDIDGHVLPVDPKPEEHRALYEFHNKVHQVALSQIPSADNASKTAAGIEI